MTNTVVDRIDALLPQTQCTSCGYKDCRAYAEAVATDQVEFNRCAPGGAPTVAALAEVLNRKILPLDPDFGNEPTQAIVAFVREPQCIGCYKCAAVCPVDAFIGAPKRMHTVIESECTGCGLCLPVCPMDCIDFRYRSVDKTLARDRAEKSRHRYRSKQERLQKLARTYKSAHCRTHHVDEERETRIHRYLEDARCRSQIRNEMAVTRDP